MDSLARRALASALLVTAIAVPVAGCGESGDSGDSPLDNALGYVPKDSPFVAVIETDPESAQFKNAAAIVKKFPFASQLERQLESGLGGDTSYERDVKPLLGNEFVVGATNIKTFANSDSSSDSDSEDFIAAIQVKDGEKLTSTIEKENPKELGEKDGAKLYQNDDSFAAVKDDVLVVANSRRELEAGLTRRGEDDRFGEEEFEEGTEGLPENAALRTYFNLQRLIASDPDTKEARKVKWVGALRTFGLSASTGKDKVEIDFNMGTDSDELSDADLPLAAGDQSPEVMQRPGQFGFGLRGIDQIVKFGENAGQAVNPSDFGSYESAKSQIEKQLKLDLEKDVVEQLSGDVTASASPSGGSLGMVADVKDPEEFEETLESVTKVLPAILSSTSGGGRATIRKSGDIYTGTTSSGSIAYGMVGDKFVLSDTPAGARAVASAPTEAVEGAEGAFAMKADAGQVVTRALAQLGGSSGNQLGGALGAQLFVGPLGDLAGSVKSSTSGVSGKVTLTFD